MILFLFSADNVFSLSAVTVDGWFYLFYVSVFITSLASFLITIYIPRLGAVESSLFMLLEPPTATLFAFLVFGDTLTGLQFLGGALIMTAVALPLIFEVKREKPCTEI